MGEGGGHWEFKYATNLFVFTSPCDPPAHIVNFLDENGEPIWTQGNLLPGRENSRGFPQSGACHAVPFSWPVRKRWLI